MAIDREVVKTASVDTPNVPEGHHTQRLSGRDFGRSCQLLATRRRRQSSVQREKKQLTGRRLSYYLRYSGRVGVLKSCSPPVRFGRLQGAD